MTRRRVRVKPSRRALDAWHHRVVAWGMLYGSPAILVCAIGGLWLYERLGGTDRQAAGPWFLGGIGAGVLVVAAFIALRYRLYAHLRPVGHTLVLDEHGLQAEDRAVRFAEAAHLYAAVEWDEDGNALVYDFRWLGEDGAERLRVGGWEGVVNVAEGEVVAAGVVDPDGAVALLLEAERRWAATIGADRPWVDEPVRVDRDGIHDGETLVPWSAVTRAVLHRGDLTLHVEGREPLAFSRTVDVDFAHLVAIVDAHKGVVREPPIEVRPMSGEWTRATTE